MLKKVLIYAMQNGIIIIKYRVIQIFYSFFHIYSTELKEGKR